MKFLNSAQKLKSTRKYLKMKQEDLVDEKITRGLISMIEIGKRELTNNVASKLIEKFKKRAQELNIILEIDIDFLLRTPNEDAELYCLKKLREVNKDTDIYEILEIANKFNLLNIKAIAYSELGEYNFNNKNYNEAFFSYNNSIDIFKNIKPNDKIPYLYLKIGLCKAILLNYTEALSFFNLSEQYSKIYNDKITLKRAIYNSAKCNVVLNKVETALKNIEIFLTLCNKTEDFTSYINANILKANCYEAIMDFNTAIAIYKYLLNEIIDPNNSSLGYIYNNLGLAYLNKNDFNNSLKYFNKAENFRINIDPGNLSHTIIEKSDVFIKQGLYANAIKLIESGLKLADSNDDYEYLVKGNYKLIHIYGSINDYSNLKKVCLNIITLLTELNKSIELVSIYTKLAIIYLDENNIEEAKKYLLMSQKLQQ
ncbi:helix-turn-helix domain-containing protein [Clostridium beijerinckii]|uniref:helix-turn-helix domain-containing protein n=2 Tax=Clostridium beijerinckii TaxID=1520 RepID=UPI00098BD28E|nr:helix-turn-helix transcriptional regulator [Clostridium beijerinckii]NRT37620.1 tetratricopeptide (TPR) repeat protein [Clostridium beijerinckii]NSB00108.1 tetratricopeptide (TPR) repeat protein [Clostridium beijerinckii]OOM65431.1 tetratricopeptide repeat protein [Clostridium beijerinckii]OOM70916.1 tetratricopeptide repeat protein [Clostridium beijerinckii]CUU50895.1 Transcriptional regulator, XRE family [Clostridium beijerinckii]